MMAEKKNKRFIFADLLKIPAFFGVFIYHFLADRSLHESLESVSMLCGNFSVSAVAVGIFFIISGFGLMLSYERKEPSIREYYLSRMPKLLIPYLVMTAVSIIFTALDVKLSAVFLLLGLILYLVRIKLPARRNLKIISAVLLLLYAVCIIICTFYKGLRCGRFAFFNTDHPWTYIFMPFGLSSYLSFLGMDCADFGIGEWFIGVLVLMYLVFPLIRLLLKKWNHFFFIGCTVLYMFWVWFYPFDLTVFAVFSVKLWSFIFGAWLAMNFRHISKKIMLVSLPLTVITLLPLKLPFSAEYVITLDAVMILLTFFALEDLLQKFPNRLQHFITEASILEYPMFLIHHTVINIFGMSGHFQRFSLAGRTVLYFIFDFILTLGTALLLRPLIKHILSLTQGRSRNNPLTGTKKRTRSNAPEYDISRPDSRR